MDFAAARFADSLRAAARRRAPVSEDGTVTSYRLIDGSGDGVPGVYLDRYGPAAVLNVHEDARLSQSWVTKAARLTLDQLAPFAGDGEPGGLEAVYVKPFVRDRSRLGGRVPSELRAAGELRAALPSRPALAPVARNRNRSWCGNTGPASKCAFTTGSPPACSSTTASTAAP